MAGLALIVIILVLVSRRRGGSISLSPLFWVWVGKCVELFILLVLFGMTGLFGGILLAPAFILLFTPSFVLKLTVVPLGLPRVAYWMARWCRPLELVKET